MKRAEVGERERERDREEKLWTLVTGRVPESC
jgi:hypothetical protein